MMQNKKNECCRKVTEVTRGTVENQNQRNIFKVWKIALALI